MADVEDTSRGPSGCMMWLVAWSFAIGVGGLIGILIHAYGPR